MRRETLIENLFFDMDQVPIEALVGSNGSARRISIPVEKVLIRQRPWRCEL
jgi:hypothetical protein